MKKKVLAVGIVIAIVLVWFLATCFEQGNDRYHQHLEVAKKEACTEHGDEEFCTHLPLIHITTEDELPDPYVLDEDGNKVMNENGSEVYNNETVLASVSYYDDPTNNNHLDDDPQFTEQAYIRIRGASSREYDKKGYLLKFVKDDLNRNKKVSFSGMSKDNEWVLHGPFLDKTLIRNYLCYNLAGEIMEYAPNVRFCEAFLNGEYIGVYLICEKVTYSANGRIQLEKSDPDITTTSYIVQIDRGDKDESRRIYPFATYSYIAKERGEATGQYEIVYPASTLTPNQREYIEKDISKFEKALYSFDYKDGKNGYSKYIDVESFVDYFLINEFTLNYDATGFSTYLYKDVAGKLKLCVWDFNSAFDYYEYSATMPETFLLQESVWYKQLFKDEQFVALVVERYHELRETYFNEEYLEKYIDETVAYLSDAIDRNYEKWGYSFQSEYNGKSYDYLFPAERNVRTYEEAIDQLKDCIHQRLEHMDAHMERLYTLCHSSLNKKYNHNSEAE